MATFTITGLNTRKQRKYNFGEDRYLSMCVYLIMNRVNGKQYIGQTRQRLSNRLLAHFNLNSRIEKGCTYLRHAIAKYGADSFDVEVLAQCADLTELDEREVYWITELNTIAPNGYNLTSGGGCGFVVSEETRKRQSVSAKNKDKSVFERQSQAMKDKYQTDPSLREFMAAVAVKTHTGRKQSPEQVEKRAAKRRGQTFTLEQQINLARGHMQGKRIGCSNGKEYLSALEASLDTGAVRGKIGTICNGKRKSSNGLTFWYK